MLERLLPFKNRLLAMFFAILVVALGAQHLHVTKLQADVAVAQADARVLQARVDAQNTGLMALKRAADDQAQESAKASQAASRALSAAQRRADEIAAKPAPATCPEAIQFLIEDARTWQ